MKYFSVIEMYFHKENNSKKNKTGNCDENYVTFD